VTPRKVIFGTTTNIHSTGILIVVDEKKYLMLIKRPCSEQLTGMSNSLFVATRIVELITRFWR